MSAFHLLSRLSALSALSLVLSSCGGININILPDFKAPLEEYTLSGSGSNKILVIPLEGIFLDTTDPGLVQSTPGAVQRLASVLKKAEKDSSIKAVLLKINSPGGSVTASDIMYKELLDFKRRTGVKVVACSMDLMASGGYYVALAADKIQAHPTSVVGSIGTVFIQPELAGLMEKIGVAARVTKSGTYKDIGSPFREPTEAEAKIMQEMIDLMGKQFADIASSRRGLKPEQTAEIRTARIYLADQALALGLIDGIGYLDDAIKQAQELSGVSEKDSRVVVYRRSEWSEDTVYNTASSQYEGGRAHLVDLGLFEGACKMKSGFYYLWAPGL